MKKIVDLEKWNEFCTEKTNRMSQYEHYEHGFGDAFDVVSNWLVGQPDTEGKHGKWIRVYNRPKSIIFRCALCGGETYKYIQEYSYPFCPNCGAKMDLGEERKKTYKEVFFEKFPEARRHHATDTPVFEACHVWPDADFECGSTEDCDACWNKEYE